MQQTLPFVEFQGDATVQRLMVPPFKSQLLKWIGHKQRFAHEIVSYFPAHFGTYFEPFW
jgi:DNA adenine methylase